MGKSTIRGYVPITIQGEEYTLRLGTNALADLDDLWGTEKLQEFFSGEMTLSISAIRALLFVSLNNGGHKLSLAEVGDMMIPSEFSGYAEAIKKAIQAGNLGTTEEVEVDATEVKKGKGKGASKGKPFRSKKAAKASIDHGDEP